MDHHQTEKRQHNGVHVRTKDSIVFGRLDSRPVRGLKQPVIQKAVGQKQDGAFQCLPIPAEPGRRRHTEHRGVAMLFAARETQHIHLPIQLVPEQFGRFAGDHLSPAVFVFVKK